MQEIINAMLKAILLDANQQKPITYSVRRWNDMFVEFHSWYIFEFKEWMIDITNVETWKKERIRDWVNAKLSNEVLKMLKDWLNKDFNSWIAIEDDTTKSNNATDEKEDDEVSSWDDNEWGVWEWDETEWEETTETSGEKKETSESAKAQTTKKLPWWAAVKWK